jgi:hypothetical protein
MLCGDKWKSCDCPWLTHETMEPEEVDHTPVPTLSRSETFPRSRPSRRRRGSEVPPDALPLATREHSFEDEMLVRRSHDHRGRDLALRFERVPPAQDTRAREREGARGLERELVDESVRGHMNDDDYDYDDDDGYDFDDDDDIRGSVGDDLGYTSRRRRRDHDDYQMGDETVIPSSPLSAAPPHGFDRTARTADYISDVSRARGVRGSSMERRLAERFAPQRTAQATPLPQSPILGHPRHAQHGIPPMSPMMAMVPSQHMPIAPPAPTPPARRHTAEEDLFNMVRGTTRGPPMVSRVGPAPGGPGPGWSRHEYGEEMMVGGGGGGAHGPPTRRYSDEMLAAAAAAAKSTMAGLDGPGRGMNRVYDWMNYVAPGPPPDVDGMQRRRLPLM